MSMLKVIHYYGIPRDEDGRPSREYNRLFNLVLRWWPEFDHLGLEQLAPCAPCRAPLRNLHAGNDISQRHLDLAIAYLAAGFDRYAEVTTTLPEPYEGRNTEAALDFRAMLDALVVGP